MSALWVYEQAERFAKSSRLTGIIDNALEWNAVVPSSRPYISRRFQTADQRQRRFTLHLLPPVGVPVTKPEPRELLRRWGALTPQRFTVMLGLPLLDPAILGRRRSRESEAKTRRVVSQRKKARVAPEGHTHHCLAAAISDPLRKQEIESFDDVREHASISHIPF